LLRHQGGRPLVQLVQISLATTLRHQPPSWPERLEKAGE
jgi:hypothetical protein